MQKIWKIKEKLPIPEEVSDFVGDELLENLFVQRGLNTVKKIREFLNPLDAPVTAPFAFTDMEKAVDRISKAIAEKEKIVIYGDFDADGVTSTSLLFKTLKYLGADVDYYIPERELENHGMNTKALVKLISKNKAKLIITVDCGISDIAPVNFANGFKVDVIITDHHEAPEELPCAYAIINPKAMNALNKDLSAEEIESLNMLAGVGVAFKLACALLDFYGHRNFVDELLPFVAIGTIADVVPLLLENRTLVVSGLNLISKGNHYGIKRLLETISYNTENCVTSEMVAFGIAPRINAAGRLATVDEAVKLLISDDKTEIELCCSALNNYNKIRQELSDSIYTEAMSMPEAFSDDPAVILYKDDWHIGIIGIVASKLVEEFGKPVFLMMKDENTGLIRCSARSVSGVHLHEVLVQNADLFEGFGGHSQAAGLTFDPAKHGFEEVKRALNSTINIMLDGEKPEYTIDVDMELTDIDVDMVKTIQQLEPFGAGNPNPVFAMKNLTLTRYKTIGSNSNHLKIFCENSGKKSFECVYWNHSNLNIPLNKEFSIIFYPKINVFNGDTTVQLDIQDIKSDYLNLNKTNTLKIYDHRKKTNIFSQICSYLDTTKLSTGIFVEDKEIKEFLKSYPQIFEKIHSRKNLAHCNQVMFFDYPASSELMNFIIKETGAKVLHFMGYDNKKYTVEAVVKTVCGMLKYAVNNKNSEVNLIDLESASGLSDDMVRLCIDMFAGLNMIRAEEQSKDLLKIEFINPVEMHKIKESEFYDELETELEKIYTYRQRLCVENLDDIFCTAAQGTLQKEI